MHTYTCGPLCASNGLTLLAPTIAAEKEDALICT
jgi:hypothetical protein